MFKDGTSFGPVEGKRTLADGRMYSGEMDACIPVRSGHNLRQCKPWRWRVDKIARKQLK